MGDAASIKKILSKGAKDHAAAPAAGDQQTKLLLDKLDELKAAIEQKQPKPKLEKIWAAAGGINAFVSLAEKSPKAVAFASEAAKLLGLSS